MKLGIIVILATLSIAVTYYYISPWCTPTPTGTATPTITKNPPNIDWNKYPKEGLDTNISAMIAEINKGNVYSVRILHSSNVHVYTKDYRYLRNQCNDKELLKKLDQAIVTCNHQFLYSRE